MTTPTPPLPRRVLAVCATCADNVARKSAAPNTEVPNVAIIGSFLFAWCECERVHLAMMPSVDGDTCVTKNCETVERARGMSRVYIESVPEAQAYLASLMPKPDPDDKPN
jgi:hypothetical protein